jgi:hypothetical protein
VLARDDATGHIGTFQTTFVIPNLNKETKRVAISSVVLSGQRTPLTDAVYNATKGKEQAKQNAADPLVQDGMRMVPSVTRVFNKARPLYVYLQVYQQPGMLVASAAPPPPVGSPATATAAPATTPPAFAPQPLIGFVTLYQGGKKVFESKPEEVAPNTTSELHPAPLNFALDVSQLAAGKYECQVTVLNPNDQKTAFWQAPILLTQ